MSGRLKRNCSCSRDYKSKHFFTFSHGFGNWSDIADFIGTGKTREEVEEHYQRIYIDREDYMPVLFRFKDRLLKF